MRGRVAVWTVVVLLVLVGVTGVTAVNPPGGETITVPFTIYGGTTTAHQYSGRLRVRVSGYGDPIPGDDWAEDAFYAFRTADNASLGWAPYMIRLSLSGCACAQECGARKLWEFITDGGPPPPYSESHEYVIDIDVGSTPVKLTFGNGDCGVHDNSGSYRVTVTPLPSTSERLIASASPNPVRIPPGQYAVVRYTFSELKGVAVELNERTGQFLLSDGTPLMAESERMTQNILVYARGTTSWDDYTYMPPDKATEASRRGYTSVILRERFYGRDAQGIAVSVAVDVTIIFAEGAPSGHSVSTPATPTGPTSGTVGQSLTFSTGGASCNQGHGVEYQFDWGDGTRSSWSSSTSATKSWSTPGTYAVKAQARCTESLNILSSWSAPQQVHVTAAKQDVVPRLSIPPYAPNTYGSLFPGWTVNYVLTLANEGSERGNVRLKAVTTSSNVRLDWTDRTVAVDARSSTRLLLEMTVLEGAETERTGSIEVSAYTDSGSIADMLVLRFIIERSPSPPNVVSLLGDKEFQKAVKSLRGPSGVNVLKDQSYSWHVIVHPWYWTSLQGKEIELEVEYETPAGGTALGGLRIKPPVFKIAEGVGTFFRVDVDGYSFPNQFPPPYEEGLCFGMVKTAGLYYNYWTGQQPNREPPAPYQGRRTHDLPKEEPVVKVIRDVQRDATWEALERIIFGVNTKDEVEELWKYLKAGYTVMVGFRVKGKGNHIVLAYGAIKTESGLYVNVYDPNSPDDPEQAVWYSLVTGEVGSTGYYIEDWLKCIPIANEAEAGDRPAHTYGGAAAGAGWYLVSTPSDAEASVFGVVLYRWNAETRQYEKAATVSPISGYWAYIPAGGKTVIVPRMPPMSDQTVPLGVADWHLISVPWPYPRERIYVVKDGQIRTWNEAVTAGWVEDVLFGYEVARGWTQPTMLSPWYGYWLKAKVSGLSLRFHYAFRATAASLLTDEAELLVSLGAWPTELPPPPRVNGRGMEGMQFGNYPNPITDVRTTTFRVTGPMASLVTEIRVLVFDLSGKLVWQNSASGAELTWHTEDLAGQYLANGVYLYQITAKVAGTTVSSGILKLAIYR